MTKKAKKRGRSGSGGQGKPQQAGPAHTSNEAIPLDDRPRRRGPTPVQLSAKQQAAAAKKAARARLMARD
jgi:hypothetical protein